MLRRMGRLSRKCMLQMSPGGHAGLRRVAVSPGLLYRRLLGPNGTIAHLLSKWAVRSKFTMRIGAEPGCAHQQAVAVHHDVQSTQMRSGHQRAMAYHRHQPCPLANQVPAGPRPAFPAPRAPTLRRRPALTLLI
jgi:hypothetical protein